MKLSIVIPTYRGAARVRRLLGSIAEHGRLADEVILLDDGSPDADVVHLAEVLDEFPFADKRLYRGPRRGWTFSVNEGVRQARGEIVLLLDDDALLPAGLLCTLQGIFAGLGPVGVLSWRSQGDRPGQSQNPRPGYLEPATQLAGFCYAFRRALWAELHGFDPRFGVYCADSDFALRAMLAGHACYRVWWPLVPHLEHRSFEEAPELGDRNQVAVQDLAAFLGKWGAPGPEMEVRALKQMTEDR